MKIGINASFLRKPDTGIGQVTSGFVKDLIEQSSSKSKGRGHGQATRQADEPDPIDSNKYVLYLEKDVDFVLPKNFEKRIFLPSFYKRDDLVRKIIWEKFILPSKVRSDRCEAFISLYPAPTKLKNVRHVMLVHDMIWKIFPEYLDNWRKKLYAHLCWTAVKKADHIATVSQWSRRDIQKYLGIPKEKIAVCYPSIDKGFWKKSSPEKDNAILDKYDISGRYIFYISGFDLRKNVEALLRAFSILIEKEDSQDLSLVLAGEEKSEVSPLFTDVKRISEMLGITDRVKLTGFLPQDDVPAFYRNAELFIFPSLYEGFGLMLIEAMASGAPVATSKISSLPEVAGDAALFFNPYDGEEIARVMGKILRNLKLKRTLSEKGRERAKKFTWHKFSHKLLSLTCKEHEKSH